MNRPIDTLFYHWVVTEDDKNIPTVFEDISELPDETKIDAVLTTYAECVGQMIEAEIFSRMVVDSKIAQIQEDDELADEDMDLVAQAIDEDEDVIAAAENAEEAKRALNLLHSSIVKVFAREV
jgi:hypothetical protein